VPGAPSADELRGLRHCAGLRALVLSKVGAGVRALPALGLLVAELPELVEIDLSVNAFCAADPWAAPPPDAEVHHARIDPPPHPTFHPSSVHLPI
jgi:hypothetical protein